MQSHIFVILIFVAEAWSLRSRGGHHHAVKQNPSGLLGLLGYELTWQDNFKQVAGLVSPSSANWIIDNGTSYPGGAPNWGNNEAEVYTNSLANVHVTTSNTLAITPRRSNGTWTSGRIETRRKDFAATSGGKLYIEARLKTGCASTDRQQGIWSAFWALGGEFRGNYTNWPGASEWDFMEVVNGLPTTYNTLHCGTAPGGLCNEYDGIGNGGVAWTGCEWHAVGFEVDRSMAGADNLGNWGEETLRWFLDGAQVHEILGSKINDSATWDNIAHKGHFLLLNVAVGGNWPGQPNATTLDGEGVQMEVDFVRVWNSYSY